jgi:organic hydroperoxide reductase OsmC/OhrA
MIKKVAFKVVTQWKKGAYENAKSHDCLIEGKQTLHISAAKEFKGAAQLHNPEDLLLSALSSCHMMSYFYVCQQHGIEILEYSDAATGTFALQSNLSGAFTVVQLNPMVVIDNNSQITLAIDLHKKAHELCFIANSVNFDVVIVPKITVVDI